MSSRATFCCLRGWLAVALILFTSCYSVFAIDVGGPLDSNTVWALVDSPFVVTSTVVVASNTTLTIEEGSDVQLYSGASIVVLGRLSAVGTDSNTISFRNYPSHGKGGGLCFLGTSTAILSATGELEHCTFTRIGGTVYKSASYSGAVYARYSSVSISDSALTNVTGIVLYPNYSRISFVGNVIHDTGEAINAVRCAGRIASNRISKINGSADGIDLDYMWTGPGDNSMMIEYNIVSDGSDVNADGIDLGTSPGVVRGNVVSNFADKGISIGEVSAPIVYNNLVVGCTEGISIKDGSTPVLMNNTIAGCSYGIRSREKNGGAGGGKGAATNMIIWGCGTSISLENGSTLDVSHSLIEGGVVWPGDDNINEDPHFVQYGEDFRLLPGSPCIDTGTNLDWMTGVSDLWGIDRIKGVSVDMGAYECSVTSLACNAIADIGFGLAPLQVVFTAAVNETNGLSLTYFWDFENDGTNTIWGTNCVVVTNTYGVPGTYSVRLTVSNELGDVAEKVKSQYIKVGVPVAYVATNGTAVFPYTNWATAARSIGTAVNAGVDGTEVRVGDGTYALTSQVVIVRGISVIGVNGPAGVIVDGNNSTRCFDVNHDAAMLKNITVTGGYALDGGGIFCRRGIVEDCIIVDNAAIEVGGGVNLIPGGRLRSCVIASNSGGDDGGGVRLRGSATVENCTIVDNSCSGKGGGVACSDGGHVLNTILYFNTAGGTGDNWYDQDAATFEYCCTVPRVSPDSPTNDPFFIDAGGDYRLRPGSLCIDGGTNVAWMSTATDVYGNSRLLNATVDIGAHEYKVGELDCNLVAGDTYGFLPLDVSFTTYVAGTNTDNLVYYWDFNNDGTNELAGSGFSSPSHVYMLPGVYSVRIEVVNGIGESAIVVQSNCVRTGAEFTYVSPDGGAVLPYTNWAMAARDIQSAINAGIDGSSVIVTDGTYTLSAEISLDYPVTVGSVNGAEKTLVDGGGSVRCVNITDSGAVWDGFTVTGGYAQEGGGIYCREGTVRNCIITNNSTFGSSSGDGGGVYCRSRGLVENCIITMNSASDDGGGVANGNNGVSAGVVRNCLVFGNTAADKGGGVMMWSGALVENCTVYSNTAAYGGGLCSGNYGNARNVISYYNAAGTSSNVNWYHVGNDANYYNCCTWPDVGGSSITNEPGFMGLEAGNVRLSSGSPCVDSGQYQTWMGSGIDLDGFARVAGDVVDIGAFEFDYAAVNPDPADNDIDVTANTDLCWTDGKLAVLYHVYVGTSQVAVIMATTADPEYIGSQSATTNTPAGLNWEADYYWRIDCQMSDGLITTGTVWHFTTGSPGPIMGATDHSVLGSDLVSVSGTLISDGAGGTEVYVVWGTNDEGSVFASWSGSALIGTCTEPCPALFSTNLTGLAVATKYYFRFFATNWAGGSWSSPSDSFTTPRNWNGWLHSMDITFSGYDRSEVLTNFPLLVRLSDDIPGFEYSQFRSGSGVDLMFADSAGTDLLDYEVENWATDGVSHVWVKVPELVAGGDSIRVYWGNMAVASPPASTTNGDAWNSGYLGVWHLAENEDDATLNGNDGANIQSTNAPGVAADANGFDGIDDYIQLETSPVSVPPLGASNFTLSAWFKRAGPGDVVNTGSGGVSAEPLIAKGMGEVDGDNHDLNYFMGIRQSDGVLAADFEEGEEGASPGLNHSVVGVTPVPSNTWCYAAVTYDGTWKMYLNGQLERTMFVGQPPRDDSIQPASIGASLNSAASRDGAFKGCIDEARVSGVARSSNWIWACWLNQQVAGGMSTAGAITNYDWDVDGMADAWELDCFGATTNSSGLPDDDQDKDGFRDYYEYVSDTDPMDPSSRVRVVGVSNMVDGLRILWQGGRNAVQLLERKYNLASASEQWVAVYTNTPPTSYTPAVTDSNVTGYPVIYRIRIAH